MTFTMQVNDGPVETITIEPGEEHGHVCANCGEGWMCSQDCPEDSGDKRVCAECE